jgi:hypothetical protein
MEEAEPADSALMPAIWVLWWAVQSEGVRGRWTLASVVETAYRKGAKSEGLDPMPWKTVASALRQLVPFAYNPVTSRGVDGSASPTSCLPPSRT